MSALDDRRIEWGVSYRGADGLVHVSDYDDKEDAENHLDLYGESAVLVSRMVTVTPWIEPDPV